MAPAPIVFERNVDSRLAGTVGTQASSAPLETQISSGPRPPAPIAGNLRPPSPPIQASELGGDLTVSIEQMSLPAFIQAVYGGILQLNYSLDAAVSARTDLITFRTPKPLSAAKLTEISAELLKSYGVAVQDFGGVLRIVPSTTVASTLPLVRRGRAQPTVPLPMRPVFHYIETEAVRPQVFLSTLQTVLGDRVKLQPDNSGGLMISGQPDDVQMALELIQVFDQPGLRGQNNTRVVPRYWGAEEFVRRLSEVLKAEGYSVGTQSGTGDPITLIALPPINSVLVFASSKEVQAHVLDWVKELDQFNAVQAGSAFFTYPVRNADAQELAKSLNELIGGANAPPAPAAFTGGTPPPPSTAGGSRQRRVVVNNATNSLIFQGGSQEDYRQWLSLLAELDRPVKSALIDVLVAEVALADDNSLGFSWQLDQLGSGAQAVRLRGTTYSAGISGSGLSIDALLGGNPLRQLAISALASNSDSRVISNPKVMTRNGETASISVGQEVPTVTSQGVAPSGGIFGSTNNVVPQTIQYRNTGVLLRVRPVIHAGDRIDLEISQEVSSAEPTTTGVTTSPTIRKRSIETKLSIRDGATVMLGGLISETTSDSASGVPFLQDIPGMGNLFKRSGRTRARTELVILITPYIINDSSEAEAATDAYQATMGDWAQSVRDRVKASREARSAAPMGVLMQEPLDISPTQPKAPTKSSKVTESAAPPAPVLPSSSIVLPSTAPVFTETKERMINLTDRQANVLDVYPVVPAASSSAPTVGTAAPASSKPAPAAINGISVPTGATVVEDPELIRQILDATRKR
ncbi:MAG: secretin N-terminal domain-containing protein [Hydrogenophaga sp.]|uniref:secretin N-terminal domain-containing protein n=1 Tax=Hydrogenophaga sp. TaxID=1904254 RepID=UPI002AB83793|nr:secretin N-terminal domain-containing protein [Hydrogenophaga sp.]MDZ4187676.1 secretin N-terminal domain-containing protein [Hydrogenophaga sp.]